MVGLAPIIRAWVESPVLGRSDQLEETSAFYIEHGLLRVRPTVHPDITSGVTWDNYFPLPVFIGDVSRDFATTVVGTVKGAQFPAGKIVITNCDYGFSSPGITKQYLQPSFTSFLWKVRDGGDTPSETIHKLSQQMYIESLQPVPATPNVCNSAGYTGFLRLAVQYWLGAGMPFSNGTYRLFSGGVRYVDHSDPICPWGLASPDRDGLIYDNNYNFWYVRIAGLDRVVFVKMDSDIHCVKERLADGTAIGRTKDFFLMLYILSLRATDDVVTSVVPNIKLVIGDGRDPLSYGWHFNRAAPWKAAIVTHRVGAGSLHRRYYYESTFAVLSMAFADGVPNASIQIITQDMEHTGIGPFWYLGEDGVCPFARPPTTVAKDVGDWVDLPLYCFYRADNGLELVTHTKESEVTVVVNETGSKGRPCGGSGPAYSRVTHTTQKLNSVSTTSRAFASVLHTEETTTTSWSFAADGSESFDAWIEGGDGGTSPRGDWSDFNYKDCESGVYLLDGLDPDVWNRDACYAGSRTVSYAIATEVADEGRLVYTSDIPSFGVIPWKDAEAIIIGQASFVHTPAHTVQTYTYTRQVTSDNISFGIGQKRADNRYYQFPGLNAKHGNTMRTDPYSGVASVSSTRTNEQMEWGGEVVLIGSAGTRTLRPPKGNWDVCAGIIQTNMFDPCVGCSATVIGSYFGAYVAAGIESDEHFTINGGFVDYSVLDSEDELQAVYFIGHT